MVSFWVEAEQVWWQTVLPWIDLQNAIDIFAHHNGTGFWTKVYDPSSLDFESQQNYDDV